MVILQAKKYRNVKRRSDEGKRGEKSTLAFTYMRLLLFFFFLNNTFFF